MSFAGVITGEDEYPTMELTFTSGGLSAKVVILEPCLVKEDGWRNFIAAIRNRTRCHLNFYCGNGEGYIESTGTHLHCLAMPSGSGGDVSVEVSLPLEDKLAEVFESLIAHPSLQADWASKA